jgi:hypothetical protein
MVRQVTVPKNARALSTLPHVDYEDAFIVGTGPAQDRTAEQWARAILEGAPIAIRQPLQAGWRSLGLQLGSSRSDGFVLGWEVRRSTPEVALLGARSRLGLHAELLFKRRKQTLLYATFVQQENLLGRAVWAGVDLVHRPVVRHVLLSARRRRR